MYRLSWRQFYRSKDPEKTGKQHKIEQNKNYPGRVTSMTLGEEMR